MCVHQLKLSTDEYCEIDGDIDSLLQMDHSQHSLHELNPQNINPAQALFTSIMTQHMRCYSMLMEIRKRKPRLKCKYWSAIYSPLHVACKVNDASFVKKLLQNPTTNIDEEVVYSAEHDLTDPMSTSRETTPLSIALQNKHYEIMKLLRQTTRVNVLFETQYGDSVLFCAARDNEIELIQLLIRNNVCLYL